MDECSVYNWWPVQANNILFEIYTGLADNLYLIKIEQIN
jgi:hypothetical protein